MATKREEKANFWLEQAKSDKEASEIMLKANRYNWSAFMCQQTIEKLLKAVILKGGGEYPYTHNLINLAKFTDLELPKRIQSYLEQINPHYIPARYPERRQDHALYNRKNVNKLMKITFEVFKWFIKKMS